MCNPVKLNIIKEDVRETICAENAAIAIENILLCAVNEGLGSAWISNIDQEKLKKLLDIPKGYIVRGVIPIGYPIEEKQIKGVIPSLKEIVHIEKFNKQG